MYWMSVELEESILTTKVFCLRDLKVKSKNKVKRYVRLQAYIMTETLVLDNFARHIRCISVEKQVFNLRTTFRLIFLFITLICIMHYIFWSNFIYLRGIKSDSVWYNHMWLFKMRSLKLWNKNRRSGVKGIQVPWNISPPSINLHGVSVMFSVACRDDSLYNTSPHKAVQGGLIFRGTFIPIPHLRTTVYGTGWDTCFGSVWI